MATTLSKVLDTKLRFDTGREFLKDSESNVGFFRSGVSNAVLSDDGTYPASSDMFMMVMRTGNSTSAHLHNNQVGIGSREQVFFGDWLIIFPRSAVVTLFHTDNSDTQDSSSSMFVDSDTVVVSFDDRFLCISPILVTKKLINLSARSFLE